MMMTMMTMMMPTTMMGVVVTMTLVVTGMMGVGVGAESALIHQPDWGSWSYLEEDFTLTCQDSDHSLKPNNFVRWELPNGEFQDLSDHKYELKSDPQGQVINMHLTVRNVQDGDSGVYVCHIYSTHAMHNKIGHAIRGLNLGVHLYREPFDKYEHGVLVGGCAAAALLVLLSAGCLIYKFRYRSTFKEESSHLSGSGAQHVTASRHSGRHLDNGAELSAVVADADGGRGGMVNRSYDHEKGGEIATRM